MDYTDLPRFEAVEIEDEYGTTGYYKVIEWYHTNPVTGARRGQRVAGTRIRLPLQEAVALAHRLETDWLLAQGIHAIDKLARQAS